MRKTIKYGIILSAILIVISISMNIYASTNDLNSTNVKSNILINNLGENQIQVTVNLSNLANIGEGINAYSGLLNFNSNELEFVEFTNVNDWNNPTYKILENGMNIVSTSNKFLKEDNNIFRAVFNKKVNKDMYDIKISNLELAAKVNGETIKVNVNTETILPTETLDVKNTQNTQNIQKIVIICLIVFAILVIAFAILKRKKGGK